MVPIILVTGYKPYSSFKRNSSGEIAELLDGSYFKGREVVGIAYDFKNSVIEKKYPQELKKGYEIIINTGITPGRNVIGIEKVAINWQDPTKDEVGTSAREGRIVDKAPDGIFSRLPVAQILHSFRSSKLPSQMSYCAGTSMNNKIFFYSLYFSKAKAGLIQFPIDSESSLDGKYPTMLIDNMIKSVEIAIEKTIRSTVLLSFP